MRQPCFGTKLACTQSPYSPQALRMESRVMQFPWSLPAPFPLPLHTPTLPSVASWPLSRLTGKDARPKGSRRLSAPTAPRDRAAPGHKSEARPSWPWWPIEGLSS